MCTPNTVIHMSRTINYALRLGLYAPDTQVIPIAPIYYCNFDRPLYGHISFSKFGGLKGAMVDGEGAGLIRGLAP